MELFKNTACFEFVELQSLIRSKILCIVNVAESRLTAVEHVILITFVNFYALV